MKWGFGPCDDDEVLSRTVLAMLILALFADSPRCGVLQLTTTLKEACAHSFITHPCPRRPGTGASYLLRLRVLSHFPDSLAIIPRTHRSPQSLPLAALLASQMIILCLRLPLPGSLCLAAQPLTFWWVQSVNEVFMTIWLMFWFFTPVMYAAILGMVIYTHLTL